jgi:hypothetical protein
MKSMIHVQRVYDLPYYEAPSDGCYRHIDLRVHPKDIDAIPELRSRPDLKELVATLNCGPFMTHGSAFALAPPYEPAGTVPLSPESMVLDTGVRRM